MSDVRKKETKIEKGVKYERYEGDTGWVVVK